MSLSFHAKVQFESAYAKSPCLNNHFKIFHTGEKPHACKYSDCRSSHSSYLNTHITTKHPDIWSNLNKASLWLDIAIVKKAAFTLMKLRNWIELKLSAELFQQLAMDPFATSSGKSECPYCLKIVATSLLERHMAIHITGRAGYSCGLCYKTFERKDSLKKHEKVHTGEKPHACKYCDYRSSQSSNLNTHIRTKHPDIWANLNKAVRTAKQPDDNGS